MNTQQNGPGDVRKHTVYPEPNRDYQGVEAMEELTPTSTRPASEPVSIGNAPSEPVSIGNALADLLPRLRVCHCGKPATDGMCAYHADEHAAFYTTPKGR